MKNTSVLQLHSLKEVMPRYRTLTGLETNLSDVVDVAMIVVKAIGNIALATYSYKTDIVNYLACLPCDVHSILSVTHNRAYTNNTLTSEYITNGINDNIIITSNPIVEYTNVFDEYNNYIGRVEALNLDTTNFTLNHNKNVIGTPIGNFLSYARESNRQLKFNISSGSIEIIYRAIVKDSDDFVLVEDKTITAIARFLHYLKIDQGYYMKIYDGNMVERAEKNYSLAVGRARIGEPFTANQMDSILESGITFKRKSYGLPFRA